MDLSAAEALRLERQIIVADCQVGQENVTNERTVAGLICVILAFPRCIALAAGARRRLELPASGLGLVHARWLGASQGVEDILQGVRPNQKALHAEGGTRR